MHGEHLLALMRLLLVTDENDSHFSPGRFFAGVELKAMMAHLIMNYEVRSEVDGVAPKPEWVAEGIHPSPKILTRFRRRVQRD